MSTPHDDGGPAYPTTQPDPDTEGFMGLPVTKNMPGMSLRDWFAGQAIQGFLANQDFLNFPINNKLEVARFCWDYADAMLADRQKNQSE